MTVLLISELIGPGGALGSYWVLCKCLYINELRACLLEVQIVGMALVSKSILITQMACAPTLFQLLKH